MTLAPMETKSPELIKVIFLALKKRPEEALFSAYKNTFISEDLQCTEGIAPDKILNKCKKSPYSYIVKTKKQLLPQ